MSERRASGRKKTSADGRQSSGLWVQLPGESYWFYVRQDAGRRRFVIFDREEP